MISNIFHSPYPDKFDSIRYRALIGYCLFQLVYVGFILVYSFLKPELYSILFPVVLYAVPITVTIVYFARKNYRNTTKVYTILTFVVQCAYLFSIRFSVEMNITSLLVFVTIAILAFAVVNKKWGIALFGSGIAIMGLNYILKDAYMRSSIATYDINGVFFHVTAYTISLFGFTCYLLYLFEKYLLLYLKEIETSNDLNTQLEQSIELVNIVNANLELHIKALSDANYKLSNYAWTHSHEVRAPVARILGLLNLVKVDKNLDKDFFTGTLLETAKELDDVILRLNRVLEEVSADQKNI